MGEDILPISISSVTTKCRHCKEVVNESDAKVQAAYWTPHHYVLWHNECHLKHHKQEVFEQQKIDKDCNECINFSATSSTDKNGNRFGICKKFNKDTTAYPGGQICMSPIHDDCFEHRDFSKYGDSSKYE